MTPLLLSRRAAAEALGVGRNGTLNSLLKRGVLRLVVVDGREFISRHALEDLARNGEALGPVPTRKAKRKSCGSIADIEI